MTILISRHTDGHRREWASLFSRIVSEASDREVLVSAGWPHALSSEPLLYLMIEDSPSEFFVLSFLRALFGLRTAGFLFRPGECVRPANARLRIKRLLLRLLRLLPRSAAITLLPDTVEPRFRQLARYTIADPQLWDLAFFGVARTGPEAEATIAQVRAAADGRRVLLALGAQDRSKGFDYLCRVWQASSHIRSRWLFVVAGRVDPSLAQSAHAFRDAGGLLIDRFIDDKEMQALYANANLVWSCYAPGYDQASGIFGRAVQLGVPVASRSGTYIEKFATLLRHPCLALPWNQPDAAAELLERADEGATVNAALLDRLRVDSVQAVLEAVGLVRDTRPAALARRAAWNIAEVAATAISLFVIYKLVVEQLGVAALGVYSLVLATTVFARIGDLGMSAGLTRFVGRASARSSIDRLTYVETAFVSNLLLYALLGALAFFPVRFALHWALNGAPLVDARALVPYTVMNFILFNVANVSASALTGFHRSDLKSALSILAVVLLVAIAWILVPSLGLIGIALGQIAQNAFVALSGWYFATRIGGAPPRAPWRIHVAALKEMLGFGVRLQVTNIISLAYEPATKFILAALAGPAALGLFELSYRVVVQARALILAPSQNLTPMFAAIAPTDLTNRQRLYENGVVLFVIAGGIGLAAVILASPVISYFLVHHLSVVFVQSVVVLSIGWFVNIVSEPAYLMAIAEGRTRWNTAGTAMASLGSPVLGYLLWHIAGELGIVAGFALATASGAAIVIFANVRSAGLVRALPSLASWRDWYSRAGIRFSALFSFVAAEGSETVEIVRFASE